MTKSATQRPTDLGPTECETGCRIEVVQFPGIGFGKDSISFSRYSSK